jgi:hypothetical protein
VAQTRRDNERTSPKDYGQRCMVDFDVGRKVQRFKGSEAAGNDGVSGDVLRNLSFTAGMFRQCQSQPWPIRGRASRAGPKTVSAARTVPVFGTAHVPGTELHGGPESPDHFNPSLKPIDLGIKRYINQNVRRK